MQFELSLAGNEAASTRRITTLHLMLAFVLCGLGAGCLVLYWFTKVSPKFTVAYRPFLAFGICSLLAGLGIAAISVFYRAWLLKGRRNALLRLAEGSFIAMACLLFALSGQKVPATIFGIVAVVIAAAALWEIRSPKTQSILIDESGISLPKGGSRKKLRWSEIESLLLRHSILSIELSGNRLIQHNIQASDTGNEILEAFSAARIKQYEKERVANAAW